MELAQHIAISQAANAAAAATSAVESSIIDTANYDGVIFVTTVAVANAGNNVTLQHNTANATSGMAAIAGAAVVIAANNQQVAIAVHKPTKRFLRAVITRTASTATGGVHVILYRSRKAPDAAGITALVSPINA